jgi:hypothetical protein
MARALLFISGLVLLLAGHVCGRTLYETRFDAPDAVAAWHVVAGTWQHDPVAGTYTCSGTNDLLSVYRGPLANGAAADKLADCVVTAELSRNTSAGGVCGRYQDINNYYYLRHHAGAGQLQLYRIATAGKVMIASAAFATADQPDRFILSLDMAGKTLSGKMLDLEQNELASVKIDDSTFTSGGVGIRNWSGTQVYHAFAVAQIDEARFPTPADGATGVTSPLLQWAAGATGRYHNVYVGTQPELTEANLIGTRLLITMSWYTPGLEPGVTYYWRVDEVEADMVTVHPGNVWSFVAQALTAYQPRPAHAAGSVSPAVTLSWQPGRDALQHHLYFSANAEAVRQGTAEADKGLLKETTFAPEGLTNVTTYYWRVDEVLPDGKVQTGEVWSFSTFLPIDDFESYTDDLEAKTTIFDAWIDGLTNGLSGSVVGNATAPFAEQTVVHGGKQAMPLDYNNVKAPYYSEAERQFAPTQDWTANGVNTLIVFFRGNAGNGAGTLYVAVEDGASKSAIVAHPDPAAVKTNAWTEWKIPLTSFTGVNMARIKKLSLGVGDRTAPAAGGAGRIYLDDICVGRSS